MDVTSEEYTAARRQLHTVAEWLLAGPQHATSGTIRLEAGSGGIATTADPAVRITAAGLTVHGDTFPLSGTVADLARRADLPCERPAVTYHDAVAGGPDTELTASPDARDTVLRVFDVGSEVLDLFSQQTSVLWPEHFDLAIRTDDTNYGISPGDTFSPSPYAYVGPDTPHVDPFWNAPFGAYLTFDPTTPDAASRLLTFFETGRDLAHP